MGGLGLGLLLTRGLGLDYLPKLIGPGWSPSFMVARGGITFLAKLVSSRK